jgi:hypothetical protein
MKTSISPPIPSSTPDPGPDRSSLGHVLHSWAAQPGRLAVISILAVLPLGVVFAGSVVFLHHALAATQPGDPPDVWRPLWPLLAIMLVQLPAQLLHLSVLGVAALDATRGQPVSLRRSFVVGARRLPRVAWVMFKAGCLVNLASLALVVPGIWAGLRLAVALPAVLDDDRTPIRTSFRIMKGQCMGLLGSVMVLALMVMPVLGLVALASTGVGVGVGVPNLGFVILPPLGAIALAFGFLLLATAYERGRVTPS